MTALRRLGGRLFEAGFGPGGIRTLAVIVALSVVVVVSLVNQKNTNDLSSAVAQATALLGEAQSRSVTQTNNVSWGVHFSNATNTAPFYAIFSSSYSPTTSIGYYRLPPDVAYATATLPVGTAIDVLFQQISGLPVASATIGFVSLSQGSLTSTISVSSAGVVSN